MEPYCERDASRAGLLEMRPFGLREFEHAITFKVALMVKKYLTSKPVKF